MTHYYLPDRPPFLNLSDLGEEELWKVTAELQGLRRAGRSHRMFGRTYVLWRRATEAKMRELFIEAGGMPQRHAPHYFVLGTCRWYERLASGTRAITLPMGVLPDEATSFTYPDSFGAMGLGPEFGQPYFPAPYHGHVYKLGELRSVIERFGLPDDSPDEDYADFPLRPFEKYIEIQLWVDDPIREYLPR